MMERAELQDAARKAFGDGGLAPDADKSWTTIADMGWLMMAVPEELGGLGLGREAEGVIHTELGRALVPGPAIAQMLVISALSAVDVPPWRDALLDKAMGGELMTCSLSPSPSGEGLGWGTLSPGSAASVETDCPTPTPPLKGRGFLTAVPDADRAGSILVVQTERVAIHPAPRNAIQRSTWDETRRLFDVELDAVDGLTLAEGQAAAALTERLQTQLLLALAADSLGGAAAILALTIDYLKTRRQFDRPLAMFQALKHRVADLKVRLEGADALFWSCATGAPTLIEAGALKAYATTTCVAIAEEAVQLHGGIGLTAEHHCHLFLKRALLNAALGGDNDDWDERAGRALMETYS